MQQKNIALQPGTLREQLALLPDHDLAAIVEQSNNWSQHAYSTQWMTEIAQNMKEIPVLPSEIPPENDVNPLKRVEFPEEGGVLTWMDNFDFPYRGYPHYEFVDKIDVVKKLSRAFMSGLFHALKKRNRLWFLTLIPSLWFAKVLVRAGVYVLYKHVERFRIKPERYCRFIRELHRAFPKGEFSGQIRDMVCMILEMDNAYRYRAQDILVELDRKALKKNTAKELLRLLDVLSSRENREDIKNTWVLLRFGIRFYVLFDRELKNVLYNTLDSLDLEKVRLTNEDKQFCIPRKDYTCGFITNPTESEMVLLEKAKLDEWWTTERKRIRDESTAAHQGITNRLEVKRLDDKYTNLLNEAERRWRDERKRLFDLLMTHERI